MFIDTHTHLYADAFDPDRSALIKKAVAAGIKRFYMPNIDLDSIEPMLKVAGEFPENCIPMMGLHPTSVDGDFETTLQKIRGYLEKDRYIAIGEIGIDLYWDKSRLPEQTEAFTRQVKWAVESDLPIVIHVRESFDQVMGALTAFSTLPRGIFHCFTGSVEQAEKVIALGRFKLGIGGVLTFKNSHLRDVVKALPLDNFVLETDAPYLAPAPFRGKRNEPAYILEVARCMAGIKDVTLDEVAVVTTSAANEVFGPWN